MPRHDGRSPDDLRPVSLQRGFVRTSPGSVLYRSGATTVLVTAHVSDKVPPFLEGKGVGWLTAEYAMLPGSTPTRKERKTDGRATEIQRLIGRSLRAVIDMKTLLLQAHRPRAQDTIIPHPKLGDVLADRPIERAKQGADRRMRIFPEITRGLAAVAE